MKITCTNLLQYKLYRECKILKSSIGWRLSNNTSQEIWPMKISIKYADLLTGLLHTIYTDCHIRMYIYKIILPRFSNDIVKYWLELVYIVHTGFLDIKSITILKYIVCYHEFTTVCFLYI